MKTGKKIFMTSTILFTLSLLVVSTNSAMAAPPSNHGMSAGFAMQGENPTQPRTSSQAGPSMGAMSQDQQQPSQPRTSTQGGFSMDIMTHGSTSESAPSVNIITNKLYDTEEGNILGWNPDGASNTFWILDTSVDPTRSTIVADTTQSNFVVCSVDYITYGAFELFCNEAPSEGGEIHYAVLNAATSAIQSTSIPDGLVGKSVQNITSSMIGERIQNNTGNVTFAPLPMALNMTLSNTTLSENDAVTANTTLTTPPNAVNGGNSTSS